VRSSILLESLEVEIELFSTFLIFRTHTKFVREKQILALGVCFSQPCSSAGRRFAASRSRLHHYRRIVSFPQQRIRWNAFSTGFYLEFAFVRVPNPTFKLSIIVDYGLNHRFFSILCPPSFFCLRTNLFAVNGQICIHIHTCIHHRRLNFFPPIISVNYWQNHFPFPGRTSWVKPFLVLGMV